MKVEIFKFSEIPDFNEYVANFNETFGRQNTVASYREFYEDPSVDIPAKVVAVKSDVGLILSAAVVSFQRVNIEGEVCVVGVMGGAWTIPEFRGCGHMRKMIAAVVEDLKANSLRYMCGFGLASNVSLRFEKGAGAYIQPVWYLNGGIVANGEAARNFHEISDGFGEAFDKFNGDFIYTREQFEFRYGIGRGAKVLRSEDGTVAIVEDTEMSLNLNFLSADTPCEFARGVGDILLWNKTRSLGKPLFVYVSQPEFLGACEKYSFDIKQGYFSILPVSETYRKSPVLKIMMGDRL